MKKRLVSAFAGSFTLIAVQAVAQQEPQLEPQQAAQEAEQEHGIELFEAPHMVESAPPVYPMNAARRGAEGWVDFNFMVDPEGKPYEIYVVDHAGDDAFVSAARRTVERSVYAPARIGGEAIDGSARLRVEFILEDAIDGSRPIFGSRYRRFMSTLTEASQAEADSALDDLEEQGILNHYEDAYLNLARYTYALKYGGPAEQMKYLKAAIGESIGDPDFESVLDKDAARDARRSLIQLQVQNAYFGEALDTFALMRVRNDDEGVKLFREAVEQLEAFRANDRAYPVAGQLNDNGSWLVSLFKRRFRFEELEGAVEDLKLRCEGQYVFFDFDPDIQYNVSPSAGECTLEVIGDPGTTFMLVQAN